METSSKYGKEVEKGVSYLNEFKKKRFNINIVCTQI